MQTRRTFLRSSATVAAATAVVLPTAAMPETDTIEAAFERITKEADHLQALIHRSTENGLARAAADFLPVTVRVARNSTIEAGAMEGEPDGKSLRQAREDASEHQT